MPRPCTICQHAEAKAITSAIMGRVPLRKIEARYRVSKSALDRHISGHVSKPLRKLASAELSLPDAAALAQPVLGEMRKLNARALKILQAAEVEKDHAIALNAIRECRRNLELIAKLTGELDPRASGETPERSLNITVQYVDKQLVASAPSQAPPQLPAGGAECPR